jgi:hypothetical protein
MDYNLTLGCRLGDKNLLWLNVTKVTLRNPSGF